jgi:glycerophosphoryl diester phosphodiesterase
VAKIVRDAGLAARVTLQSFDWRTLVMMRNIAPEIERVCLTVQTPGEDNIQRGTPGPSPWTAGLDVDDYDGSTPRLVAAAGCSSWSPNFRSVTPGLVAQSKALGLKVIPWTVNDRADQEGLIDLGVDGLISDYPDRLRAALAAKGIALPPPVPLQ